jgi:hypothetical protein
MDKKEYYKEYYQKNKKQHKDSMKKWKNSNSEKVKEYQEKWKKNNPEKVKKTHNDYKKVLRENRRKFLEGLKKEKYCIKCGEKRWYVLDFHHVNPKTKSFNLGDATKYSYTKIKEEVNKCVTLCRNCHQEFHFLNFSSLKEYGVGIDLTLGKVIIGD